VDAKVAPSFDLAKVAEREAWAAFAPRLHIEDAGFLERTRPVELDPARRAPLLRQIKTEGYIHETGADLGVDVSLLAQTVRDLTAAKLPPVLAFVYDEFWAPFRALAPVFKLLLGDYAMLPDMWVWDIDPKAGDAGWTPHRDKGHVTLAPDRSPNSLTAWIPLTPATPLNSCMYVVPAMLDPTYGTPREGEWKFELGSIRALPAQPGDFLMWTQALLHWGSKSAAHTADHRISMAFEFQRTSVAPYRPLLLHPETIIPFDMRLALIYGQIHQYSHMHTSQNYAAIADTLARAIEAKRALPAHTLK
jgi:hypothetical protein